MICTAHQLLFVRSNREEWAGHIVRMCSREHIQNLVGKTEGRRQLCRPRCRWENNVKMDHRKWDEGFMKVVLKLQGPQNASSLFST
jgi:hypothetical protein